MKQLGATVPNSRAAGPRLRYSCRGLIRIPALFPEPPRRAKGWLSLCVKTRRDRTNHVAGMIRIASGSNGPKREVKIHLPYIS